MTEDEDRSLRIMKRSPLNAYLQVEREMLTLNHMAVKRPSRRPIGAAR